MWKKPVRMLSSIMVCLCAVCFVGSTPVQAAGGPAWIYAEDINAPWVPAEHFTAAWESVSFTSKIYNPVEQPNYSGSRSLAVSSVVDIIDTNGIIGLSSSQRGVLVLDQSGKTLYSTSTDQPSHRTYRSPMSLASLVSSRLASRMLTQHYTTTIPMDPNLGYPTRISELEWSIDALVADTTKQVDIPFAVTTEWAELVPGLEILVEQASVEDTTYSYRIKARYDSTKVQYSGGSMVSVSDTRPLPTMILISTDVLNAQGLSVRSQSTSGAFGSSSSSSGGSSNQTTATISGSGSCSVCGTAATIRQVFAVSPYEKEARFVLDDIPVPSF